MDATTVIILLVTAIFPLLALTLKDEKPARGRTMNVLIIIGIVFTYLPLLLAVINDDYAYSWFMIYTIPVGGLFLIILCILKLLRRKPKAAKG